MSRTRGSVFAALVSRAKGDAVALVREDRLELEDALYLLRALDDLEADGVELFDASAPADHDFYQGIESYVSARVGQPLAYALALCPDNRPEVHA